MRMDDAMYAWRDVVCVLHVDLRSAISDLSHCCAAGGHRISHFRSYYTHLSGKRDGAGSLTTEGMAPAANPL